MSRNGGLLMALLVVSTASAACGGAASDVAPPVARTSTSSPTAAATGIPQGDAGADAAVDVLGSYLREQALAVNAGISDPARLPGFTATLTPSAQEWALPLLAENLGDQMPGPYPFGVRGTTSVSTERAEFSVCLQDRGWQVDPATGEPLNEAHFGTARAVVVRVGERWLLDDLAEDGGQCSAADVDVERF